MLDDLERNRIKNLIQGQDWPLLERCADELCNKIALERKLKNTVDEIAIKAVHDDGQIEGIKRFLRELLEEAKLSKR